MIEIVTNGRVDNQLGKLRRSGVLDLLDGWCVSEETGIRKPDPRSSCSPGRGAVCRLKICAGWWATTLTSTSPAARRAECPPCGSAMAERGPPLPVHLIEPDTHQPRPSTTSMSILFSPVTASPSSRDPPPTPAAHADTAVAGQRPAPPSQCFALPPSPVRSPRSPCSARRNRRISAQSSTSSTCFLPSSVPARVSEKLVHFRLPRGGQFSFQLPSTRESMSSLSSSIRSLHCTNPNRALAATLDHGPANRTSTVSHRWYESVSQ